MGFPESKKYVACLGILTTIGHILIGGVALVTVMFGHLVAGTDSFKQHVMLTCCGYVLLMGEGILSLSKQNGWTLNFYAKNIVHRVCGVIGASLVIAGSVIRIQGWPGETFSTPHGRIGWIALILTCITVVGGLISIYIEQKRVARSIHALAGCLTFVLGMVALCIGLDKASFRTWSSDTAAATMIAFTAISTIVIAFPVLVNTYRRLSRGSSAPPPPLPSGR